MPPYWRGNGENELVRPLLQDTQLVGVGAAPGPGGGGRMAFSGIWFSPGSGWELRLSEYTL